MKSKRKPSVDGNLSRLIGFISNAEVRKRLSASEDRIRRAYDELFSGYQMTAENILNDVVHVENYTGVVTVQRIHFYSFCEHHFAPFFGTADVSYHPDKIITGLGKIVRLVRDCHARRLQIQETMTRDIANDMMRIVKPKGVCVTTRARHLCMCSRGPSDDGAETVVTFGLGTLDRGALCLPRACNSGGAA